MANLVIGFFTMMLCLLMQAGILVKALRYYREHISVVETPSQLSTFYVLNMVFFLLVVGNLLQISIWAWVFCFLGEFDDFSTAVYHSAVNFATLGYGDMVMSAAHRLLGPIEAINGVIMIGVTTAALMSVMQDAINKTRAARQQIQSDSEH